MHKSLEIKQIKGSILFMKKCFGYTHFTEGKEYFGAELRRNKANRLDFGVYWVYYLDTNIRGPFVFGGAGVLNEIGTFTRSDIAV
jgi:hypothetical protein